MRILFAAAMLLTAFVGLPWLLLASESDAPFVWILLVQGLVVAGLGIALRRRGRLGPAVFTLGVVLLVLCAFETYRWRKVASRPRFTHTGTGTLIDRDPALGYAPLPNGSGRIRVVHGDREIFDVTPHHGPEGTRVGPRTWTEPASSAVLCLGCSFMYGHGLPDEQALPYRLEELLGARDVRVYNFAYSGWGAHHMLRGLQEDWMDRVAEEVEAAVYLCIPDHVYRAQGSAFWDRDGPRYVLDERGRPELVGSFDDATGTHATGLGRLLRRSHLAVHLAGRLAPRSKDPTLLVAIVEEAARTLRTRWPEAAFHVVLWDEGMGWSEALPEQLEATGLPIHRVSALVPGLLDREDLRIPGDPHPSAATIDRLARAISSGILERAPAATPVADAQR